MNSGELVFSFNPACKVWLAASKDDMRPTLTGVYLTPNGYLAATDTRILAVVPADVEGVIPDSGILLPADLLYRSVTWKERTRRGMEPLPARVVVTWDHTGCDVKKTPKGRAATDTKYGRLAQFLLDGLTFPNFAHARH